MADIGKPKTNFGVGAVRVNSIPRLGSVVWLVALLVCEVDRN